MKDWLGNELAQGDLVLYSSTSTLTGMNLGELVTIDESKIQIRIWYLSIGRFWSKGKLVTLFRGTSAHKSVTKYVGLTLELED